MFKRAIVIGPPGAGKSTFSRALRDLTGLSLYYLDMIWFKPDGTEITKDEFDFKLNEILKQEEWIIDGNYIRTLDSRLRLCDIVFLLDFPIDLCLTSAESRIGKEREDLPWEATEFDEEFRQFIIDFPKIQLPQIYEALEHYKKDKKIVIFKSRSESDEFLSNFSQNKIFKK